MSVKRRQVLILETAKRDLCGEVIGSDVCGYSLSKTPVTPRSAVLHGSRLLSPPIRKPYGGEWEWFEREEPSDTLETP